MKLNFTPSSSTAYSSPHESQLRASCSLELALGGHESCSPSMAASASTSYGRGPAAEAPAWLLMISRSSQSR